MSLKSNIWNIFILVLPIISIIITVIQSKEIDKKEIEDNKNEYTTFNSAIIQYKEDLKSMNSHKAYNKLVQRLKENKITYDKRNLKYTIQKIQNEFIKQNEESLKKYLIEYKEDLSSMNSYKAYNKLIQTLKKNKITYNEISLKYKIQVIENELTKKEQEEKLRKEIENMVLKDDIVQQINDFTLRYTLKFDNKNIDQKEYFEKIKDLIKLLKYKGFLKKSSMDSGYLNCFSKVIEQRKWGIYIENLKSQISYVEGDNEDIIIEKYINFYGENSTDCLRIEMLSKVIKRSYTQTLTRVKIKLNKIKKEYKLREFEKELYRHRKVTINDIDKFNGYEFEDFLAELFKNLGYVVEQTAYSGDYGADLILSKNNKKIAVQAKNYSGSVGVDAVQQVLAGKQYYNCDIAVVITNSYFTRQAIELASKSGVKLNDRDKLINIIENGIIQF